MVRSVTQAHRGVAGWKQRVRLGRCRRRESFEGQERRAGKLRFATKGNRANPRIGSRAKQTCTVGEDQTVEVVRNHADGTREGLAVLPRRETRRRGSREADSPARYDGGAIFGQPQERMSGWRAGPHGSGCDGTVGVKVKRVARTCSRMLPHPIVGTSRAPAPKASKVEEGSGEANSRGSDRGSPPVEASADVGRRRETAHQRESANIGRSGCGSPRPTPLGEAGGSRTNRPSGQIRSLVP